MENQVKEIARRIAELRQICNISKEEMSAIQGISLADYEKCEQGETDFSYTFLHKCAKSFGVDVSELISGDTPKLFKYQITRKGEGLPLRREKEFRYDHLAPFVRNRLSDPFVVTAKFDENLAKGEIPLSTHTGEEMSYVLSGKLKFQIGERVEILNEGDFAYYNSGLPHGMVAVDGDCKFLAIVLDPDEHEKIQTEEAVKLSEEKREKVLKYSAVYEKFVKVTETSDGGLEKIDFHFPENFNFAYDVVDELARTKPNKLAMKWLSKNKEERDFTFYDMKKNSDKCANYFMSMGIKKGDKVMLILKRHHQFWTSILALHKIGAIAIPATDQLLAKDLAYRFNKASVTAVVATSDGSLCDEILIAEKNSPTLKLKFVVNGEKEEFFDFDMGVEKARSTFVRPQGDLATKATDPMLMYFTSGTTSYPKIAQHNFTYALGHFVTAKYWHNVDPGGIHFTISDTGWGKAVWGKLYGQWLCEAAVFTYDFDRFHACDILPLFKEHQITTFCAPPTMYRFFIKEDLSKFDFSSIRRASIAGEALNPEIFQRFKEATGLSLHEGFGQTETTLTVANLVGTTPKVGSMGKPNPEYDVDVVNASGVSTKVGEPGEIVLRLEKGKPIGMFDCYFRDQDKTAAAMKDNLYHTGDMCWRDEDGYFWYVGRIDDLIKSSGYRIGPFEIESVIMELPFVLECAVTGAPDPVRGQVVKASIVLTSGKTGSEGLKKEIQDYVKTHTAPYKYPRIVEFVDELPKTISGKIMRMELREK